MSGCCSVNKRFAVRIISFCAAAALAAGGYAIKARRQLDRYRLEIQNGYSRTLDTLNGSVENIYTALRKAEYMTGAKQVSNMAAHLLTEAQTAKNALSQLPAGNGELTVLNRFLSQVGNYAMSVSKQLISGETAAADYAENIAVLKDAAQKITDAISASDISYNNLSAWAYEIDKKLDAVIDKESLAGSLDGLEQELSDLPTLVYDGPYSDHITTKEPLMIKNANAVNETQAQKTAALVAGTEPQSLNSDGTAEGKIPVYRFSGDNVSVTVSKNGGYPVYMRKSRAVGDSILEYRQVLDKAKRFLEKLELGGFTETYYFTDEGVCVVSFAYLDGRTVCYTDLIKVGVAMDNGDIMLFEASGYLTNHTERAFNSVEISPEKAAEVISPDLSVRSTALALIPTDNGGEVRCYEFVCEAEDGQEILIYVNAVTGEQEDILILLKSDGGTLTK